MTYQFIGWWKFLCILHVVVSVLTLVGGTAVRCADTEKCEKPEPEEETAARKRFGALMQLTCWAGLVWLAFYSFLAGYWLVGAVGRAFKDVIGTKKKSVELTPTEEVSLIDPLEEKFAQLERDERVRQGLEQIDVLASVGSS